MRKSGWTPSIVPNGDDQNVYIVVDDFGRKGRAYRETDVERTDLEAVIMDRRELVAGCLRRCCPGAAPPLRSATARRAVLSGRVC
jgi:hypothetical protein